MDPDVKIIDMCENRALYVKLSKNTHAIMDIWHAMILRIHPAVLNRSPPRKWYEGSLLASILRATADMPYWSMVGFLRREECQRLAPWHCDSVRVSRPNDGIPRLIHDELTRAGLRNFPNVTSTSNKQQEIP